MANIQNVLISMINIQNDTISAIKYNNQVENELSGHVDFLSGSIDEINTKLNNFYVTYNYLNENNYITKEISSEILTSISDNLNNNFVTKEDIPKNLSALVDDLNQIEDRINNGYAAQSGNFALKTELKTDLSQFSNDGSDPFVKESKLLNNAYNYVTKTNLKSEVLTVANEIGFLTSITEEDPIFKSTSSQFLLKTDSLSGSLSQFSNDGEDPYITSSNFISNINSLSDNINYLADSFNNLSVYTETDPIFREMSGEFVLSSELSAISSSIGLQVSSIVQYTFDNYEEKELKFEAAASSFYTDENIVDKITPIITGMIPNKLSYMENDAGYVTSSMVKNELDRRGYISQELLDDYALKLEIPQHLFAFNNDGDDPYVSASQLQSYVRYDSLTASISNYMLGNFLYTETDPVYRAQSGNFVLKTDLSEYIKISSFVTQLENLSSNIIEILPSKIIETFGNISVENITIEDEQINNLSGVIIDKISGDLYSAVSIITGFIENVGEIESTLNSIIGNDEDETDKGND